MSVNTVNIRETAYANGGVAPWTSVQKKGNAQTNSEKKVLLSVRIASIFRYSINSFKAFCKYSGSPRFPNGLKLANIATIPYSIYQIGKSSKDLFRGAKKERADAALNITANLGNVGDAVSSIAEGLGAVGVVALSTIGWSTPLLGVGLALQSAGMAMTAKSMRETHRFKRLFKEEAGLKKDASSYTLEDYRKGIQLIDTKWNKERSFLIKHFGVDENDLADRLVEIETEAIDLLDSGDPEKVLQGKDLLHATMKKLEKRMINKNRLGVFNLVAGLVSYIGVGLLFSPVPGVGFAVLALSGIASLVAYKVDRISTKRFERELCTH